MNNELQTSDFLQVEANKNLNLVGIEELNPHVKSI